MILNNARSLFFRWLADQAGICRPLHLAMASPNCDDSHWVGDVLFAEQQTNTNTVMQPRASLGYLRVSVRIMSGACCPCLAIHWVRLERLFPNGSLFTLQRTGNQQITGSWYRSQVWLLKNSYYGISLC